MPPLTLLRRYGAKRRTSSVIDCTPNGRTAGRRGYESGPRAEGFKNTRGSCSRADARQRGLTLIELLIALTVAAVLLGIGIPGFDVIADKRGLSGASQSVFRDLRFARSEALKRNRPITLSFARSSDTDWCYGLVQGIDPCDCTAGDCVVDGVRRVRSAEEMAGVRMPATPSFFPGGIHRTTFRPVHGTAGNGTIRLVSENGVEARVILSRLGRVRICSPEPEGYGLEACP